MSALMLLIKKKDLKSRTENMSVSLNAALAVAAANHSCI